jgi:hypothetical protein
MLRRSTGVDVTAYLVVVAMGSALVGLWAVAKLPALAPRSLLGAAVCFGAAWVVPGLAVPLLDMAMTHLATGLAILVAVFPLLTATFMLIGAGLRYLVGLTDHAIR